MSHKAAAVVCEERCEEAVVSRSGEGVAREEASRGRSEGAGAARDEAGIAGREADRRNEANVAPNQSLTFFLFSCRR